MDINVRMPGPRTTDPRWTVTITEDGTPWPIVFHFLLLGAPASSTVLVGFEIGDREKYRREPGEVGGVDVVPADLDPVTVTRIVDRFATYEKLARYALVNEREGMQAAAQHLRGPGKKPAILTDDFLRAVAAFYRARVAAGEPPVRKIADYWQTTMPTASKWVKRCRERGFLEPKTAKGGS